jgi:2-polyprenyl-3-methyl-5-hydroxy-6-metoxy-1,4-benzoquinol methylase
MMTINRPELKHYTESNRAAWNEVMPYHQRAASEKLDQMFSQPGYVRLDETEIELLHKVGLEGRNVAHLCCNNGSELMSLKNMGAAECVGFDISDQAILEASQRATRSRIDCSFVRSDVFEIGSEYNDRFDLVYISAGCLCWLPDLELFFAKAASLLRPGGLVFIHEIHPFTEMLPFDDDKQPFSLSIVEPYFKQEPYIEHGGLDYVGHAEYPSTTTQYEFSHPVSGILMGLIGNHIMIEHFYEYETDISAGHRCIEEAKAGIPLSYILIGRRT